MTERESGNDGEGKYGNDGGGVRGNDDEAHRDDGKRERGNTGTTALIPFCHSRRLLSGIHPDFRHSASSTSIGGRTMHTRNPSVRCQWGDEETEGWIPD